LAPANLAFFFRYLSLSLSVRLPRRWLFRYKAMIDRATPPEHDQIVQFKTLRAQVLHEIRHPDEYNGTPLKSLPVLTKSKQHF
jgi:hypothetical protein